MRWRNNFSSPVALLTQKKAELFLGSKAKATVFIETLLSVHPPGGYEIVGNSSNGDLRISMSPYWTTHPLEDGIYYSTNDPLPDYAEIDKIVKLPVSVKASGNFLLPP